MVVTVGETTLELKPNTLPTLLLILSEVGLPDTVKDNVAELPKLILLGLAVKAEITGAGVGDGVGVGVGVGLPVGVGVGVGTGLTVTVTWAVAVPPPLVAVRV